jgi:molybdate/tungstate transport system permease protein
MKQIPLAVAALAGLAVLIAPFIAFAVITPWFELAPAAGDLEAVRVSAVYTLVALAIIAAGGTPLAYWMARRTFRGKWAIETLILLPLLTPPLAMGLLLALFYGPYGWAGSLSRSIGLELTNTPAAFILAQVYAAAPYYIIAARGAFESVDPELERIALTLGDSPWRAFRRLTIPLARSGIAVGLAIAWVRALGEFGIVLIVAYFPQGIPVKLWVNLQDLGLHSVFPLLWLFFAVALPLPLVLGNLSRRQLLSVEAP